MSNFEERFQNLIGGDYDFADNDEIHDPVVIGAMCDLIKEMPVHRITPRKSGETHYEGWCETESIFIDFTIFEGVAGAAFSTSENLMEAQSAPEFSR